MKEIENMKDTGAWVFQAWTTWFISMGVTLVGVYYIPVDMWVRGFMAMGVLFSVASTFSLAKTVRDNHEADKLVNRVKHAKAEKMLREYEFSDAA